MNEKPLRIAVGGIHIESSTFTPYVSDEHDFHIRRGNELLEKYPWIPTFEEGASPRGENREYPVFRNVEWVPLVHARALPGGPVSAEFFARWNEEFMGLLKQAMEQSEIDGVLLDIHGAMAVQGLDDPEGLIASTTRNIVGTSSVIASSMDLHGNISALFFESCDMHTCYRTAPHIDAIETRYRAASNLIKYLRNPGTLFKSHVAVPILLPGEKTSTEVEPGKSLYAQIEDLVDGEQVMDVSIWMGFPWADQARCRGAVVAFGRDKELVEAAVSKVANDYWYHVEDFDFVGPTATSSDAIKAALESTAAPFFVSDTGDNPGAGGAGDIVVLLREMIEAYVRTGSTKRVVFSSIFDPDTVSEAQEVCEGNSGTFSIGGKLDTSFGGPVNTKATVISLFESTYGGECCILSIDRAPGIEVIVTKLRTQFGTESAYAQAGYPKMENVDVIVVKMGYLEPDLAAAAADWCMALTPGAVDQYLPRLGHLNLARPLYPFDGPDFDPDLRPRTLVKE